ncbi:MAG TPA: T9SS type A sorting domain-containing protein, partial [Chitinophagales bacterium]|nr:T9SS type A sorting domain-containing protein [Chitinophagales bacterium]
NTDITLHFISSLKATATLRLMNAIGVTVFEKKYTEAQTEYEENFSVELLPSGNYFAVIQQGNHVYQQSFSRQ